MTKLAFNDKSVGAPEDEIEITPAMVEAGGQRYGIAMTIWATTNARWKLFIGRWRVAANSLNRRAQISLRVVRSVWFFGKHQKVCYQGSYNEAEFFT